MKISEIRTRLQHTKFLLTTHSCNVKLMSSSCTHLYPMFGYLESWKQRWVQVLAGSLLGPVGSRGSMVVPPTAHHDGCSQEWGPWLWPRPGAYPLCRQGGLGFFPSKAAALPSREGLRVWKTGRHTHVILMILLGIYHIHAYTY